MFTRTLTTAGMGRSWNFSHLDQSHKKKGTGGSELESGWSTQIHAPTKRACLQTETWKTQETRPYNTRFARGWRACLVSSEGYSDSFFFSLSLSSVMLQSVFQSPVTEQTGNGMGTSARLVLPLASEAGRILATLQTRSQEVSGVISSTSKNGN